jgi:ribosome assembly protein 1
VSAPRRALFLPVLSVLRNPDKVTKIVSTLNLKILPRDLKSKDAQNLLSTIFTQWLPLSTAVIQTIIDIVPSPKTAQPTRIPKMLHPELYEASLSPQNKLETDLYACDASDDACVVAYVSKMFAVPEDQLPENKRRPLTADEMRARAREAKEARLRTAEGLTETPSTETPLPLPSTESPRPVPAPAPEEDKEADEILLGFARLYSGELRVGSTVLAVLPKYNSALPADHARNRPHVVRAAVAALYTMMGRELVPVDRVRAGNVFAIRGLEGKVWRSATLCAPRAAGVQDEAAGEWVLNLGGVQRQVCGRLLCAAVGLAHRVPSLWLSGIGATDRARRTRARAPRRYAEAHPRHEAACAGGSLRRNVSAGDGRARHPHRRRAAP